MAVLVFKQNTLENLPYVGQWPTLLYGFKYMPMFGKRKPMMPVHQNFSETTSNSAPEKHKEIKFLIRLPLPYSQPGKNYIKLIPLLVHHLLRNHLLNHRTYIFD